jgi:hypothetical protein
VAPPSSNLDFAMYTHGNERRVTRGDFFVAPYVGRVPTRHVGLEATRDLLERQLRPTLSTEVST